MSEEQLKPVEVDINSLDLAAEEVEINPDANAFAGIAPPPEAGNPYRVKVAQGSMKWRQYPAKDGNSAYLATSLELTIVSGDESLDGRKFFDNFQSTAVNKNTGTSRIAGILQAIYDTRGQGEKVEARTTHKALAQALDAEFAKESEVGVMIQWQAYCESCSTEDKRVEVKGEKRFPPNASGTGHLGELTHEKCGSIIQAQARVQKYLSV